MLIIVRLFGGLGNQLFSYSAARRLALINDCELRVDHISGFRYDTKYKRYYQLNHFAVPCAKATPVDRFEPFGRIRRNILRRWNRLLPFYCRSYLAQESIDFDPRLLNLRPRRKLYLEGYWQSEAYFNDVEKKIREDLRIVPPSDVTNLALAETIRRCSAAVAVHVRFFDEPGNGADAKVNNAPIGYYARAIEILEARISNAHYFLFSDRPEAICGNFSIPSERFTLVHHNKGDENAYADLWLMTLCQHFIIANSTFSWWGAWLAEHRGKIVIAPGFEKRDGLSSWGFKGLIPESWVKI